MSHNLAETLIFLHSFVDSMHILLDIFTLLWYNIYMVKGGWLNNESKRIQP